MVIELIARNWETFQFRGGKNKARGNDAGRVRSAARKITSARLYRKIDTNSAGKRIPPCLRVEQSSRMINDKQREKSTAMYLSKYDTIDTTKETTGNDATYQTSSASG